MYFSIHNHTDKGSNLRLVDSIITAESIFDRAIEIGLRGFSVTDHEALCSHIDLILEYKKRKDKGTLPENFVLGLGDEIYLIDKIGEKPRFGYSHFLLQSKSKEGHRLLREITSKAWGNYFKVGKTERVPISKQELVEIVSKNPGHLIGTTACLGGEFPQLVMQLIKAEEEKDIVLINQTKKEIIEFFNFCISVFGKDDFYVEFQPSASEDQTKFNRRAIQITEAIGLKPVFSTDSHYEKNERRVQHKAFLQSKEGEREVDEFYATAYMMDTEELVEYLSQDFTKEQIKTMFDNTIEIADKIEFYDLFQPQSIPEVEIKNYSPMDNEKSYTYLNNMYKSKYEQDRYWVNECVNGLKEKGIYNKEYLKRLNEEAYELWAISINMGLRMTSYYNTMKKIIEITWSKGNSLIGPARGSATGYLSCYLLGITQLDPIQWNLPHWRHLTATRPELPDIDFDTQANRRRDILYAVKEFFGQDNVLNIATFGTVKTKSACLTACRGYRSEEYPDGIDSDIGQYLSSMIPSERGNLWELRDVVYGNEEKDRKIIRPFIEECNKYPGLLDIMLSIEGLVDKRSIHASGVYIYNHGFLDYNARMKAPNGQDITQFSMNDSDYMGSLKYDFLTIEALDKISTALEMLVDDNYIQWQGTLKATYDMYLHPDVLDYDNQEMWELMGSGEVINLFQFDTQVGSICAKKVKPHSLIDAASANSLMRLMGERGGEQPVDRYIRMKNDINLWYKEMSDYGLTEKEIEILKPHYLPVFGTPNTQEDMMETLMNKKITNFDLILANKARKIVAKKKAGEIIGLKDTFYKKGSENGCRTEFLNYIWDTAIKPQLGYSFSRNHTTPYSAIALQELQLYHKYPSVYWNTACLSVNAGSADEDGDENKSTDYKKIAVAIGDIMSRGVQVSLVDINNSNFSFKADPVNNQILYGLKGVNGIGDDLVHEIVKNRPYTSMADYLQKTPTGKPQMISLIKSGAFDKVENKPRTAIMYDYINMVAETKKKLTLQNFAGLVEKEVLPYDILEMQIRTFNFNKALKKECAKGSYYMLFGPFLRFYESFYDMDEVEIIDNVEAISIAKWKKMYDKTMDVARKWLKDNHDQALETLNYKIVKEQWDKYCSGSTSKWEMDSVCFYHGDHELAIVNKEKYGIEDFSKLESMEQDGFFVRNGQKIPLYRITRIMGTVISKNKNKGTVSLLTTDGVVDVKFRLEHFAQYDKQISEQKADGKGKTITDKSWFGRGDKIVVTGYRRDDTFVCKKYTKTVGHSLYKIEEVRENGDLILRNER